MSPEDFERFLKSLSLDTEEAGRRYVRLHKKLVGFFSVRGNPDPMQAADETIDRAALKIAAGALVPEVEKYCFGIARNIDKESRRCTQREIKAFTQLLEYIKSSSPEELEREFRSWQACFNELAEADQKLLLEYCQDIRGRARAEHRRQLAVRMGMTVLALRMRVTRLRNRLTGFVGKLSKDDQ